MAVIRQTVHADIAAFPAIELSAAELFRSTDRAWVADDPPTAPEEHEEAIRRGHHWTALIDDEVAGFLLAERFGTALYLAEIAVARPFQRQGAGKALIAAAEAYATSAAFSSLTLTTYRDLPWNAPFYARLGFREIPPAELPRYLAVRLRAEAMAGHDPGLRCGMVKPIG
jgi:GNAT superfamily N-acetyltransferase